MNAHLAGGLILVAVATVLVYLFGWHSCGWSRDRQAARRQLEADQRTAAARGFLADSALLEPRAPMPTTAGWLFDTAWRPTRWADWQGAQDRQYLAGGTATRGWQPDTAPLSITGALDMAEAAYQLGQDRATADQARGEVDALWAEVDAHPEQWRQR